MSVLQITQDCEGTHLLISTEEYKKLKKDQMFLECLQAHGVDNWDGYSDAQEEAYPDDQENT